MESMPPSVRLETSQKRATNKGKERSRLPDNDWLKFEALLNNWILLYDEVPATGSKALLLTSME